MKPIGTLFSGIIFLFLLAAGAVVAEPPLPLLSFYQGDDLVESRRMTPPEHTAYLKFQNALGLMDKDLAAEVITEASMSLALDALSSIADDIHVTKNGSGGTSINIDSDIDMEKLSETVAEGATSIGKYAERVGKAAENLEAVIKRNSSDITYDSVRMGEGEGETLIFD